MNLGQLNRGWIKCLLKIVFVSMNYLVLKKKQKFQKIALVHNLIILFFYIICILRFFMLYECTALVITGNSVIISKSDDLFKN